MKVIDSKDHEDAPKIEFPCENYVIKTMGENTPEFFEFVVSTFKGFDAQLDEKKIKENKSKKGTFTSVSVSITAQSEQQLKDLHQALIKDKRVKMVL
ncbi:HP0495 family protein [Marinicellulosiphila megalodicopiae]|uniref:HP0495 family protein n=1 Tax=Marinicellulosiphila megalodicopiae TaxID=2724896 RepID=UPI003BAE35F8